MSDGNGNLVELSATLHPASSMSITEKRRDPDGGTSEVARAAKGGLLMLRILGLPLEERKRILCDAADCHLLVWFALLSKHERAEFVRMAEIQAREEVSRAGE